MFRQAQRLAAVGERRSARRAARLCQRPTRGPAVCSARQVAGRTADCACRRVVGKYDGTTAALGRSAGLRSRTRSLALQTQRGRLDDHTSGGKRHAGRLIGLLFCLRGWRGSWPVPRKRGTAVCRWLADCSRGQDRATSREGRGGCGLSAASTRLRSAVADDPPSASQMIRVGRGRSWPRRRRDATRARPYPSRRRSRRRR
mmetsp:Transcript_21719/g.66838  ORF Transcript_21719/g.66838 Transcript_21719/m.66838 type:complete len:201 (-) Transcript_21719:231-833(-)